MLTGQQGTDRTPCQGKKHTLIHVLYQCEAAGKDKVPTTKFPKQVGQRR